METDVKGKTNEVYEILKKIKENQNGPSLYEHLQKMYQAKLIMVDDDKYLDLFEDISLRIKKEGVYLHQDNIDKNVFRYIEEFCKNIGKKKQLISPLMKTEGEVPEPFGPVGNVPEYYNIFQTLEWVGISIGSKESYLLTNSLRNLVAKKSLPKITFWGKIYGTEKDYFIAETESTGGGKFNLIKMPEELNHWKKKWSQKDKD